MTVDTERRTVYIFAVAAIIKIIITFCAAFECICAQIDFAAVVEGAVAIGKSGGTTAAGIHVIRTQVKLAPVIHVVVAIAESGIA